MTDLEKKLPKVTPFGDCSLTLTIKVPLVVMKHSNWNIHDWETAFRSKTQIERFSKKEYYEIGRLAMEFASSCKASIKGIKNRSKLFGKIIATEFTLSFDKPDNRDKFIAGIINHIILNMQEFNSDTED